eukprot:CAMPEP_0172775112 /NCGR_PEP_ID=MMETSP1074-20121228/197383_1 /TAXON_ID=2916 /ORGANISM="Ceratium fusus, Strain PA161109" /LENGTH=292 /DNA_ID=CAMNT_0013611659 /DNA_START=13 /DNA_END=888 /DNA_ORIENTATION=-
MAEAATMAPRGSEAAGHSLPSGSTEKSKRATGNRDEEPQCLTPKDRLNIAASEADVRGSPRASCAVSLGWSSTTRKQGSPRCKERESKRKRTTAPVNGDEFFLPAVVRRERRRDPKHWGHKEWLLAGPPKVWEPVHGSKPSTGVGESNLWTVKCSRVQVQRHKRCEQADQEEASEFWSVAPDSSAAICDMPPGVAAETGQAVVAALNGKTLSVSAGSSDDELLGPEDEPKAYELFDEEEAAAKRDLWNEVNWELLEYWDLSKRRRLREQATAKKKSELAKAREQQRLEEFRR